MITPIIWILLVKPVLANMELYVVIVMKLHASPVKIIPLICNNIIKIFISLVLFLKIQYLFRLPLCTSTTCPDKFYPQGTWCLDCDSSCK